MSFTAHLAYLTGSQEESSDSDRRAIDAWTRLDTKSKAAADHIASDDLEAEGGWSSVLEVYGSQASSSSGQYSTIVSRLLSKPNIEPLIPSLLTTLSSERQDDDISGELVEAIGFDNIELATDILVNRRQIVRELESVVKNRATSRPAVIGNSRASGSQGVGDIGLDPEQARRRIEETLRANASRPLFTGTADNAPETLPHVYTSSSMVQGNVLSHLGTKYMLPLGTVRQDYEDYEEVILPPANAVPPRATERLIPVTELDDLAKGSFPGYTSLNRIQSIVYPTAYKSNENMLVCAPTGAGKTDVAMLAILRVLDQHRGPAKGSSSLASTINRDKFKIIYV